MRFRVASQQKTQRGEYCEQKHLSERNRKHAVSVGKWKRSSLSALTYGDRETENEHGGGQKTAEQTQVPVQLHATVHCEQILKEVEQHPRGKGRAVDLHPERNGRPMEVTPGVIGWCKARENTKSECERHAGVKAMVSLSQ